jgi:thiamine-phosphate pyrophosphorylase
LSRQQKFNLQLPRFYPIIDTQLLARAGILPVEMARALARAGVCIAQFRHKGPFTREIFAQAQEVGDILQGAGVKYVIDDRPDIALLLGSDGVHVGQDDLPPKAVRELVGDSLFVGLSTHNEQQLLAGNTEPVDYLALGPVYGTISKENPDPVLGLDGVKRLRELTSKPLVAIGGITRANARQVLTAGADSVAVISDCIGEDLEATLREWQEVTRR